VQLVDRAGTARPLNGVPPGWQTIAFSPDGRHLALDSASSNAGLWLHDVERGTGLRLTRSHADSTPVWAPDGGRLAYSSAVNGPGTLWTIAADGSGPGTRLTEHALLQVPDAWSPDGKTLLFSQGTERNQFDLWLLPLERDGAAIKAGTPTPLVSSPANEGFATFSPDGAWIAYTSDESGASQVYVRAVSGAGGRYQVSSATGVWPQWSRAKSELLFGSLDNRVMHVTWRVENGAFRTSRPEPWTPARYESRSTFAPFALHPDGARLAMALEPPQATSLVLVTDFAAGLSAKTRRAP
jgi:Tol biopolymer transport system component